MIVLDTNVISELMRPRPEPKVVNWLRAQNVEWVYTTAMTAAELWYGVHLLEPGKRRADIELRVRAMLRQDFAGRILDFTAAEAAEYGRLHTLQKRSGRMADIADTQIAAITHVRGFAVVTRNVGDFAHTGLQIINPWEP